MSGYGSLDGSGPAQNKTALIGLMAATGVVLLFTIIGTALSQGNIRYSTPGHDVAVNAWKYCIGDSCTTDFPCDEYKSRMNAVRAFSIITILTLFGAIGALGVQLAGRGLQKLIPAAVLGFAWFTWLLSWAIVAGTFNLALCNAPRFLEVGGIYGPGFALSVAAWVFLTIEVAAAVFFTMKQ
jgi:hypothetical protein